MHNAPSVVFPVGRCAFHGWLLVALGGVSGAVVALFLVESNFRNLGVWGWLPCVAGIAVWLSWTTWALLTWLSSPQGSLHWDSRRVAEDGTRGAWSWTDRNHSEQLILNSMERVLDLQDRVLLRFRGPGMGRRWAWVVRSGSPGRWSDLRRALVASLA
ncbi:hypothetical protein BSY239_2522 [Hydrogenophaga sp. RAC07]|uniref:hypothetical protein n=1 Tax=Hydrogenophaga sp. RAC07 TaxID=1842537 RepID=UPI00083E3039|nr:hypothetical protein [Hydrogenophaga sp. RAC07]AOF85162.1 hypothetical protein BSY239_2522 [Hydrogenophaga sp. RAC07]